MRGNKKYKDSVFCDYMAEGKKLVELYNAVYGTSYPPDTPVEINTLEGVLYMDRVNDLSFTLDGNFVVLVEQQSTINHNIPLRMGIYMIRLYEKLLHSENLYRRGRIPLFTPRFILLYNGKEEAPEHWVERLSDAFTVQLEHSPMELEVEMFNISRRENFVPKILQRCNYLNEYSTLVELVEGYRRQGEEMGEAIRLALRDCAEQGIMQEYLEANGAEVQNMIFTEWNWDDAFRVRGEEEFAAGKLQERLEAIRNLMETVGWTAEQAMDALKIPQEERKQYYDLLQVQK